MLKSALAVLLMMIFVGMSAIATVQTVRVIFDLVLLQVEHDLELAYVLP
jgi:hypothetical protein